MKQKEVIVEKIYGFQKRKELKLNLFNTNVAAGFPSPADDYIDKKLDLNEYLVKNPSATFFVKVTGDSMIDAGIHSGNILIVDRSITATNSKIIIAILNGELTVKRLRKIKGKLFLYSENKDFAPIEIDEHADFEVWGVVMHVINSV